MFFDKEDEDQDFLNPGGSKLGALFGMDKAGHKGGNESLTYTAPKQPKKKESSPPGKGGAPVVMFALAVNAYKYVDNKYASQGKLGAAILANHASSEYSILMYVSQQQKITTAKITSSFTYAAQANNYANFYDDARQSWSVLFDNEQNAMDFAKHVCLVKALSTGPIPTSLVSQDLVVGDGGALEVGDSVEVKYTGKLLTNNTFGQVFDSNVTADKLFRFKLGAGKVIKAWDTGVVGMKKGGKRFLVAPPSMAYGSQGMANRIPANATLLFEVEVVRVKLLGRDSSPSPAQPPPEPVHAPPPGPAQSGSGDADDFDDDDSSVKERTKSISEQLTHSSPPDTSKAKLISRMAKMGRPMIPLSGAIPAHPDSEDEHVPESPVPVTSHPAPTEVHRPVPKTSAPISVPQHSQPQQVYQATAMQNPVPTQPAFLQNLPGAQQMAVFQPQQNFLQQQQQQQQQQQANMMQGGFPSQIFPNQGQQAVPGTSYPPYVVPGMPQGTDMMLLSESRQQNTEMRLSLSKMSDKVDQVMQKMDQAHSQSSGTAMLPNMETSVLLHNITRIVQENERLKTDVFEKSGKIESQNEKISELLQRNQNFVEKSQVLMEQRNEGLLSTANQTQYKVLSLEQEKVELTKQLSEATSQISALQLDATALKKKEFDLTQQIDSGGKSSRRQNEELDTLKTQHTEDDSIIRDLQRQLKEEKHSRKTVESSSSQLQEEMSDLQEAKRVLDKSLSDRKRKTAEERRQLEDEMEDVKANLEAEVQSLKEKLRKQKTSASTSSHEQISQLEEEINMDWQHKSDRLLAVAADKHNRALQAVIDEKLELETKGEQLENRIQSMRHSSSGNEQKLDELQEEMEQLSIWKDKYESLRNNATTMKERYEERIEEIEAERDNLGEQLENVQSQVKSLKAQGTSLPVAAAAGTENLLEEVKKIMNTVYKEMRDTFDSGEKYTGTEILAVILNSIKSTTLSLMKRTQQVNEDKVESDDEEEEEESEEEAEEESEPEDDEVTVEPVIETVEAVIETVEEVTETVEETIKQKTEIPEKVLETDKTIDSSVEIVTIDKSSAANSDIEISKLEDPIEDNNKADDESSHKDEVDSEIENLAENGSDDEDETGENIQESGEINGDEDKVVEIVGEEDKVVEIDEEEDLLVVNNKDTQKSESEPKDEAVIESPPVSESNLKKACSLENMLDSALESKPVRNMEIAPTPLFSTEPPPLTEDSSDEQDDETEKDRTKSIFADDDDDDDNVADTLGIASKPVVNGEPVKKQAEKQSTTDEDKPRPPPPLFGDDDDDDDLDWLS